MILVGGGARWADAPVRALAERLDAPVVPTINARGVMHGHALCVPASPSLRAVRELIEGADVVLALGTEIGQTDFDMYAIGSIAKMHSLIRVDLCAEQLSRRPAEIAILGDAARVAEQILEAIPKGSATGGAGRAEAALAKVTA